MPTFITMSHPDIAGTATATTDAFDGVWEPLGWELVEPDASTVYLPADMRYRGAWMVGLVYAPGNVVSYAGSAWVALEPTLGDQPDITPEWEPAASSVGDYAPLGVETFAAADPVLDWSSNGPAALVHGTDGPDMTAPYLVGLGLVYDGSNGQKISVNGDNQIGLGIGVGEPDQPGTPGPDSIGLLVSLFSTGRGIVLNKSGDNTGSMLDIRADFGGLGTLLSWGKTADRNMGRPHHHPARRRQQAGVLRHRRRGEADRRGREHRGRQGARVQGRGKMMHHHALMRSAPP